MGIHFFNPVPQLQLVEVVSSSTTNAESAKKAAAFVRQIDKLPLPVKDSPGFLVNRVLGPYMHNAFRLLDEGMTPETLDAAMEAFGMPMGPAELADTVGLDICLAAGKALGKTSDVPQILANKVALGHLGKKTSQGIYRSTADAAHACHGPMKQQFAARLPAKLASEDEDCPICFSGILLATSFIPDAAQASPSLDLTDAGQPFALTFDGVPKTHRAPFQSRAPPLG